MGKGSKIVLTLCFIHQPPRLLLGFKKRGFGKGRWNGFGGKVQPGESLKAATRREVKEEAGLLVGPLEKYGLITFRFKNEPDIFEGHIFRATTFRGEPAESEEMKPRWFSLEKIPYSKMWPGDKLWLPLLLSGRRFTGTILFQNVTKVLRHHIKIKTKFLATTNTTRLSIS